MNGPAQPSIFERLNSTRVLILGGIVLILLGMLLGEVYAIFISHVASAEIRRQWSNIVEAVKLKDRATIVANFSTIQALLERRGRIVNTHSHVIAFGFLSLGLGLLQPLVALSEKRKRLLAWGLVAGGAIQPVLVFVSAYTGRWANWLSDAGSALILITVLGTLAGLARSKVEAADWTRQIRDLLRSRSSRMLLKYGAALILLGMIFGFYYAWVFVSQHEPRQIALLEAGMSAGAADARFAILEYRTLQSKIAIIAAAHSHVIEMGTMAILLAFVQNFVFLDERWKVRWARVFLSGAFVLPIFIYNATIFGLISAGFADLSGFLVVVALSAMLVGLLRYSGALDSRQMQETSSP